MTEMYEVSSSYLTPDDLHIKVLDHGFVTLRNIAGPTRRPAARFDADSIDPARCARISFDAEAETRERTKDLKLNKYLLAHAHNTPIEMIEVWMEMKLPIFVARQFVRHRTATLNECSARYITLPKEWYIPDLEKVGWAPESAKQGRDIDNTWGPAQQNFLVDLNWHCKRGYEEYLKAMRNGIPAELARTFLSLNHYTHWLWKQDLWNMLHFIGKRIAGNAQYEARVYAAAMQRHLVTTIPELMEAAEEAGCLK